MANLSKLKSLSKELKQEIADAIGDEGIESKQVRELRKQLVANETEIAALKAKGTGREGKNSAASGDTDDEPGNNSDEVDDFLAGLK